jgi:hypothetical protein
MSQLVVVGAGPPTREGGVDLFLELMARLAPGTRAEFRWIGTRPRAVARRLDAETAALAVDGRIDWGAEPTMPSGAEVVHVVTARSAAAARRSLEHAAVGAKVLGLAAGPDVLVVLEGGGTTVVTYPDVARLAELVVEPRANDVDPTTGP